MTTIPIWRDYEVVHPSTDMSMIYYVMCDGKTIYTGNAYKRPDESNIHILLNDICANLLRQELPDLVNTTQQHKPDYNADFNVDFATAGVIDEGSVAIVAQPAPIIKTFTVHDATGKVIDTVTFRNDWSYDDNGAALLSAPITGEIDPRQLFLCTLYSKDAIARFTAANGTTTVLPISFADNVGTVVIDMSMLGDVVTVEVGGMTYHVVDTCARHVIYYVNAYGGWDSLIVKGSSKEVTEYTRATVKRRYNNTAPYARGTDNYHNRYDKKLTISTGYMSESSAAKIHHLFGSTNIFIADLNSGVMRPVVITDNSCDTKTFKGEDRKRINYIINITIAQDFERR